MQPVTFVSLAYILGEPKLKQFGWTNSEMDTLPYIVDNGWPGKKTCKQFRPLARVLSAGFRRPHDKRIMWIRTVDRYSSSPSSVIRLYILPRLQLSLSICLSVSSFNIIMYSYVPHVTIPDSNDLPKVTTTFHGCIL